MPWSGWCRTTAVGLFIVGVMTSAAQPDLFRDVPLALGQAGFNLEGSKNPLSGGADFSLNHNFVGNPLDFGAWDLTLLGPISLDFSTGGRQLSQLDIALTTAPNGRIAATPLGYVLNYDVGGQSMQVEGTLLIDAEFSLNGFGFYDFELAYSSRQDVARDGRFANDDETYDFDVGPISVSGNIFADVLGLITQPFFDRTGGFNPFTSFSGRLQLDELSSAWAKGTLSGLAGGGDPVADDRSVLLATVSPDGRIAGPPARFVLSDPVTGTVLNPAGVVVPEPTVLLLMLLGLPAVMHKRRRP